MLCEQISMQKRQLDSISDCGDLGVETTDVVVSHVGNDFEEEFIDEAKKVFDQTLGGQKG